MEDRRFYKRLEDLKRVYRAQAAGFIRIPIREVPFKGAPRTSIRTFPYIRSKREQ